MQYKKYENDEGHTKKRSLRYRNWEVVLDGSVKEFGKNVIKKVLATTGFRERPKQTSRLVLTLLVRGEEEMANQLGVLVKGMISGAGEVSLEVREGVLEAANSLAEKGKLDAVQLTKVAQGAGLKRAEALEYVKISMDGASEKAVKEVYVGKEKKARV